MTADNDVREQLELVERILNIAENEDRDTDDLLQLEKLAVKLAKLVQKSCKEKKNL